MDVKVNYPKDFERTYSYDGSIDYTEEVRKYNSFVERGDKQAIRDLLDLHGGILSLLAKRQYQRDTNRR